MKVRRFAQSLSLLLLVALLGCSGTKSRDRTSDPQKTFAVVGKVYESKVIDVSKVAGKKNLRTTLTVFVESSESLSDPTRELSNKSLTLNRPYHDGDELFRKNDIVHLKVAVDQFPDPSIFYWIE